MSDRLEAFPLAPFADRVIVESEHAEARTQSGLIIPDTARERSQMGVVQAVGPDVEEVGVGMTVLFSKYAGTEVKLSSDEYLILSERDVLAEVQEQ